MISVIIVTYNNIGTTLACLESLYRHHPVGGFEVILVDNASVDGTVDAVRLSYPSVTVLAQDNNLGFGAANNIGARAARGVYLFFLNNDTLFTSPVLEQLTGVLAGHGHASAAAPRLVNPDGSFQLSVGFMPSVLGEWRTKRLQRACAAGEPDAVAAAQHREPAWVTAAALMVRARAFERIGGFDERFFMYFEDVDLCVRLRRDAGPILYEPSLSIVHIGGGSWKTAQQQSERIRTAYRESQLLFYALHHGFVQNALVRCLLGAKFSLRSIFLHDNAAGGLLRTVLRSPASFR